MREFLITTFLLATTSVAHAQTELSGTVSDDTSGPLQSGQVYHLTGAVNVPAGKTLTVQPGAIVKGRPSSHLTVSGVIHVAGTGPNPAIFTSYSDDVGGDTNLDGPSSGAPGDWRGLYLYSSSTGSTVRHAELRYGGNGNYPAVVVNANGLIFDNVSINSCSTNAMDLSGKTSFVTNCDFTGNAGIALQAVPLQSVPQFSGNTASGNTGGDYMRVTSFSQTTDVTIKPENCIGGVLVLALGTVNVPVGSRLVLDRGLVVKAALSSTHFTVSGTLDVLGTELDPVILTTLDDDAVLGDTGNDGATIGTPGSWRGLYYYAASTGSRIEHAELMFAGNGGYSPVTFLTPSISMDSCSIHNNLAGGIDFSGTSFGPTITNTTIDNNVGLPMRGVPLQTVQGLANNTASGNSAGDYIQVTSFTHSADVEVQLENVLNGQLVVTTNTIGVAVGRRLTLGPGLIIKSIGSMHLTVSGQLEIDGTQLSPVVMTTIDDDVYGGDTAKDGPTVGTPGAWRGLYFYASSTTSTVESVILRYTGNGGYAGISLHADGNSIINSVVEHGSDDALQQVTGTGTAVVAGCSFLSNQGIAATSISVNSLVNFRDNIALGNGGDFTRISNATPVGDVILQSDNVIGELLHFTAAPAVSAPNSLTFEEGVIMKLNPSAHILVNSGVLNLLGTPEAPIILTSYFDDSVIGDTNGGGAPAAPGDWRGIYLHASGSLTARHVRLSYVGNGSYAGVTVNAPATVLDHVEVRHSADDGFEFAANLLTDPTHLTAFDCEDRGIWLRTGSCRVQRSTVVGSGKEGILRAPAFTGRVADTLSYGNTQGNFSGFGPGALSYCNGSPAHAGSKGNINVDPLLVDELNGDLHLQSASPCVDAGNPHSMTDPDGSRADIGSYYFDQAGPTSYCGSKLNSLGCLPAVGWTGAPTLGGSDDFHITANNVVAQQPGYLLSSVQYNSGVEGGLGAMLLGTHFCAHQPKFLVSTASGGTAGTCSGSFDVHYSQGLMASGGLMLGTTVYTQFVYKDPAHPDGSGWGHTNALRFQIEP